VTSNQYPGLQDLTPEQQTRVENEVHQRVIQALESIFQTFTREFGIRNPSLQSSSQFQHTSAGSSMNRPTADENIVPGNEEYNDEELLNELFRASPAAVAVPVTPDLVPDTPRDMFSDNIRNFSANIAQGEFSYGKDTEDFLFSIPSTYPSDSTF
jgi:hypothetical protein